VWLTRSYGNQSSNEHVGHLSFFEVSSTNRGMHVFIGLQKAQRKTDNNANISLEPCGEGKKL